MNSTLRTFAVGLLLLLPAGAIAQVSLSPISDQTVNATTSLAVNVVAVDPDGGEISLTATLPAFATLNAPNAGTGSVVTSVTMTPAGTDVGTYAGSVTATVGVDSATEPFQIIVAAPDANQPPRVTAAAFVSAQEAIPVAFDVSAADPDGDAITTLDAVGLPAGASFDPNGTYTSGALAWTPDLSQAGHHDIVFVAANAQADSASTHILVLESELGPVALASIDDVTIDEGATTTVSVVATDPDFRMIALSATLPDFATLESPTEGSASDTLATTITVTPGEGSAGTYPASVTATSDDGTATESFTIKVIGPALEATASIIGAFNTHKKFICFKAWPVEESFDLRDVSLSDLTLSFGDASVSSTRPTHLAYDCDEDDDCDSCDDGMEGDGDDCEPSHVMACFPMDGILPLFDGEDLPGALADATIEGSLTTGETFIATIGGKHLSKLLPVGHGALGLMIRPNPMNPAAEISFRLPRPGRVRVSIYDLAGRLVTTVREGEFGAGDHSVPWDGTSRSGGRVASGVYFVSVDTARVREVQRVTVLK